MFMVDLENFLQYENALSPIRKSFEHEISPILQINDKRKLLLFWINYCSLGVGMTEKVESWIKRAGENCLEKGFSDLGKLLIKHAKQEEGHELLMMRDAENLIHYWNKHFNDKLDISVFYDAKTESPSIKTYSDLHEGVIEGPNPYGQIAIEYEIENLSVEYGTKILTHTQKILGVSIIENLSFIEHHIALDEGHTHFNQRAIGRFLKKHQLALPVLIDTGKKALKSYKQFLLETYERSLSYLKDHS
jgi:hypothetical protein